MLSRQVCVSCSGILHRQAWEGRKVNVLRFNVSVRVHNSIRYARCLLYTYEPASPPSARACYHGGELSDLIERS